MLPGPKLEERRRTGWATLHLERTLVLAAGLTAGVLLWVAALVSAPFELPDDSFASALVYQAAALICHQRPERSFSLNGVPMPVCARCFGLYASGAMGALLAWLGSSAAPQSSASARRLLGWAALPMAATLSIEWVGLANPSVVVRAVAAFPLGATGAWLILRLLRSEAAADAAGQMRYHA
jgi:uncharacterized membrane protein